MTPTAGNVRGRIHGGNTETGVVPGGVRASASKMAAVVPMGKIPPPGSPGSGASCSGAAVGGAVGGGGGGGAVGVDAMYSTVSKPTHKMALIPSSPKVVVFVEDEVVIKVEAPSVCPVTWVACLI